jgi:hypothetical protein
MLRAVDVGPWRLEVDREATRRAYAARPDRWPLSADCACGDCRNFRAQLATVYPQPALDVFEHLGLTPGREIEIYLTAPLPSGRRKYMGWFHVIGRLVDGPDSHRWAPDRRSACIVHERLDDDFALGVTAWSGLVQPSFEAEQASIVQVEFEVDLPWVLDEAPVDPR